MKNNTQHTQGPWEAREDSGFNNLMIVSEEGLYVAEAMGSTRKNMKDNASLIAAAPDLLNALEFAFKWHCMKTSKGTDGFPKQLHDSIINAIAKARGQQ